MKIQAIITGATGMVGEGVLFECLNNPDVDRVLVINRKPGGVSHPKLKEIVHRDFFDLTPIESQLAGYNACYFCLGTSSVGISRDLHCWEMRFNWVPFGKYTSYSFTINARASMLHDLKWDKKSDWRDNLY